MVDAPEQLGETVARDRITAHGRGGAEHCITRRVVHRDAQVHLGAARRERLDLLHRVTQ